MTILQKVLIFLF